MEGTMMPRSAAASEAPQLGQAIEILSRLAGDDNDADAEEMVMFDDYGSDGADEQQSDDDWYDRRDDLESDWYDEDDEDDVHSSSDDGEDYVDKCDEAFIVEDDIIFEEEVEIEIENSDASSNTVNTFFTGRSIRRDMIIIDYGDGNSFYVAPEEDSEEDSSVVFEAKAAAVEATPSPFEAAPAEASAGMMTTAHDSWNQDESYPHRPSSPSLAGKGMVEIEIRSPTFVFFGDIAKFDPDNNFSPSRYWGTMTLFDGTSYEGEWMDGHYDGNGFLFDDTRVYEGNFAGTNATLLGKGTIHFVDGEREGILLKCDPSLGFWVDYKCSGYGSIEWPNGAAYLGDLTNNTAHGYGSMFYKTGEWLSLHCEEWSYGSIQGQCVAVHESYQIYHGVFSASGDIEELFDIYSAEDLGLDILSPFFVEEIARLYNYQEGIEEVVDDENMGTNATISILDTLDVIVGLAIIACTIGCASYCISRYLRKPLRRMKGKLFGQQKLNKRRK